MIDQLSTAPVWFILFVVFIMAGGLILLGGYFLWSMKNVFADLKQSIESLKDLIHQLYDKHSHHENRISVLEGIVIHRRKTDAKEEE